MHLTGLAAPCTKRAHNAASQAFGSPNGVGDSALDWRRETSALARSLRVYAPDLPGAGENAEPRADADHYSPGFFGRFAVAFLDALGIERAAVGRQTLGRPVPKRVRVLQTRAGVG